MKTKLHIVRHGVLNNVTCLLWGHKWVGNKCDRCGKKK